MMCVAAKRPGRNSLKLQLDDQHCLARRQTGAVGNAENVGIDRDRLRPEGDIHHDVGGLAAHTRQCFECITICRNLAAVLRDQPLGKRDYILRLHVEQADRLDVLFQSLLTERYHLFGCLHLLEQSPCGLVDPDVGRLGGKRDRHQQRIRVHIGKLGLGCWIVFGQTAVEFEDIGLLHSPSTSVMPYRPGARPWSHSAAFTAPRAKMTRLSARCPSSIRSPSAASITW